MTVKPRRPAGLGPAGAAMWRQILAAYELDARELVILEQAARQADDIRALEASIAEDGLTWAGSKGQPTLSPAIGAAQRGRAALARLIEQLNLPAEDGAPAMTTRSRKARKAANTRWRPLRPVPDATEVRRGATAG